MELTSRSRLLFRSGIKKNFKVINFFSTRNSRRILIKSCLLTTATEDDQLQNSSKIPIGEATNFTYCDDRRHKQFSCSWVPCMIAVFISRKEMIFLTPNYDFISGPQEGLKIREGAENGVPRPFEREDFAYIPAKI